MAAIKTYIVVSANGDVRLAKKPRLALDQVAMRQLHCGRRCIDTAVTIGLQTATEMEWTTSTEPDPRDISYEPFVTTCPHGVTYVGRPSSAQIARWISEEAP